MHPIACIEILAGTVRYFITEYSIENRRRNHLVGEISSNGSVQFIGLSEIWGSEFPFIDNPRDPEATKVWGSIGSRNITESWSRSLQTSATNSPMSPIWYRPVKIRIHNRFFHFQRLERLWRLWWRYTSPQGCDSQLNDSPTSRSNQSINLRTTLWTHRYYLGHQKQMSRNVKTIVMSNPVDNTEYI